MKKNSILILLFTIMAGLSTAYSQSKHPINSIQKNRETLLRTNDTHKELSPYKMETLSAMMLEKKIEQQNSRTLTQLYDSIYFWKWDTIANGWAINPYRKSINIIYDANNNNTSELSQSWNGTSWVNNYQCTYTYDVNNNETSSLSQSWNGTSWVNNYQYTYTYDVNNNMTSYLSQSWNGTSWDNSYKYTYSYDVNNNGINRLEQNWNGTSWDNSSQLTVVFDANNNAISGLEQHWNGTSWDNSSKFTASYDSNNNVISELEQNWNGTSWNNSYQYTSTYDVNNNRTIYLSQHWNGTSWDNSYQYTYTYDANNNNTSELSQSWNGTSWVNNYQYTYTYDGSNFRKIRAYKSWNNAGTKVIYGDSTYYYFHTTGINDILLKENFATIYPNPASDIINLNIEKTNKLELTLNIYNVSGTLVRTETIKQYNQQTYVGDLISGIYMVEITSKEWTKIQKLIIGR